MGTPDHDIRPSTKGTMLRIKEASQNDEQAVLLLEGSLVGKWTELVREECRRLLDAGHAVRLDLGGVSLLDDRALQLLCALLCLGKGSVTVSLVKASTPVLLSLTEVMA
jgi:ABC-type transporter Mla MlaB component